MLSYTLRLIVLAQIRNLVLPFDAVGDIALTILCRQGSNELNKKLLGKINDDGRIHLMSAESKGLYFIRFICALRTEPEDVKFTWRVIVELTENLLQNQPLHENCDNRDVIKGC